MKNRMHTLDWNQLLNGERYVLDASKLGVTVSQLRTKAYSEADLRRTCVRTHKVPTTTQLMLQAFVPTPAEPDTEAVRQLSPLPFIEWGKGVRNFKEQIQ